MEKYIDIKNLESQLRDNKLANTRAQKTPYLQKVILADDLTGAMDAGVQLSRCGKKVNVKIIDNNNDNNVENRVETGISQRVYANKKADNIVVLDTESRNVPPEDAYTTLLVLLKASKNSGEEIIYKKIDSSLRGNIGKELEAIVHSEISDMVVLVPALPQNGRTTVGGYHYLHGRPIGESDLAKDPFAPVRSSFIPEVVSFQTNMTTGLINIKEVRQGKEHIFCIFESLFRKGIKIVVADAETMEDLEIIAEAIKECKLKILPCGSAGLLSLLRISDKHEKEIYNRQNIVQEIEKEIVKENIHKCAQEMGQTNKAAPLLVICGSPAKASKEQVQAAYEKGTEMLRLLDFVGNVDSLKEKACKVLASGRDLIIDGSGEGKNELTVHYKGDLESLNSESRKIQDALSSITEKVIHSVPLSGIMIIGGDTAAAIFLKLGASSIKISGEIEQLVPWGVLIGGRAEGLKLVTKAGGFGSKNVILNTVAYLKGV